MKPSCRVQFIAERGQDKIWVPVFRWKNPEAHIMFKMTAMDWHRIASLSHVTIEFKPKTGPSTRNSLPDPVNKTTAIHHHKPTPWAENPPKQLEWAPVVGYMNSKWHVCLSLCPGETRKILSWIILHHQRMEGIDAQDREGDYPTDAARIKQYVGWYNF